jgi:hypothetical protein
MTPVERSREQTQERLERFFIALRGRDGIARFRLRVPTDGANHGYGISFDREVRIEARHASDPERTSDFIEIAWVPEGTLVFPRFDGKLSVCTNSNPDACYIELDGSYTAPLGTAGQIFDAAIDRRIAQATAREVLKDLKAAAEKA